MSEDKDNKDWEWGDPCPECDTVQPEVCPTECETRKYKPKVPRYEGLEKARVLYC